MTYIYIYAYGGLSVSRAWSLDEDIIIRRNNEDSHDIMPEAIVYLLCVV